MGNDEKITQYHLNKLHPEKLQFEVYPLKDYRFRSGDMAVKPHSHSYYQIIWFFNAGGTHTIDFRNYEIKENSVFFVTKNQIHAFDEQLDISGWLIHFNDSFFMHNDVDIFLKYNIFSRNKNPVNEIDFKTALKFSNYIGIIQDELAYRKQFGFEDTIRFLLKALLILLERPHQENGGKRLKINDNYELHYLKFQELIEAYYNQELSVTGYANFLNISSKTLTTITKKITGKSPAKLVSERTILEAKRLLRYTSLQVKEIAFKLGFEDPSYFVKYFKKSEGVSPSYFRTSTKIH